MKANMGKKQSYKNIAMNVFAFVVQFFISFYISPLIVSKVGASAYGFIGLANDFVSYAAIIATVFNSVASRFIANSFYKKDYETANYYFNSLIAANIAISAVLGLAGVLLVPNLDKVLSIPTSLVFDVKLTFALIFGSYIISLLTLVFTTSTFVTNRTDIQGIRNIIQYLIRFALVVVFLNLISVRIYWVALATLIATAVISIMNMSLTKRLTPELKIDPSKAKRKYAVELAKSGSWMALTSISTVLLRGLDLTVANIFVGDYEMGLLSIARTIPNNVTSVIATIAPIFTPVFIAYYAQDNITGLTSNVKKTINTMALILFVPISGFIVFSYDFYTKNVFLKIYEKGDVKDQAFIELYDKTNIVVAMRETTAMHISGHLRDRMREIMDHFDMSEDVDKTVVMQKKLDFALDMIKNGEVKKTGFMENMCLR